MSTIKNTPTGQSALTPSQRRRFRIRLIVVLLGGMVLDGYILGIVGPVSDTLSDDLQISALTEGLVVAAALVGIFVGGPLGGWLADRVGRKPLFTFDIALFTVASFLQLFAESAVLLIAIRLLMGLAIGIEYAVGWPLMSEFAPAKLRGRLLGAMSIGFYGGFMIAFTIGYFLSEYVRLDWHLILGTSTVLSVALLIARIGMPESPRWLWSKGRQDEARAIAHRYLDDDALFDIEQEHVKKGNFRELFSRRYWRATLFTSMFWFCAVTPYFAIATFADSVLAQYGLSGGLAGGVGLSAVAVAGVVASVVLIDKVGRRVLTVPPQWIGAAVLAVIALWAGAPPIAILTLFLVFSFVNALYTTLTGVYPGEVLPTEIRGAGTGFAAAISRIGAAIGTFLLPVSMETLGASVTMLSAAGVAVLGAALSQWLAPETRGKSLTEAAESFAH